MAARQSVAARPGPISSASITLSLPLVDPDFAIHSDRKNNYRACLGDSVPDNISNRVRIARTPILWRVEGHLE
jgi:hypothetical protein